MNSLGSEQWWMICRKIRRKVFKKIRKENTKANTDFKEKAWDGTTTKEYQVANPPNFIKTNKNLKFLLHDMPGLNDAERMKS